MSSSGAGAASESRGVRRPRPSEESAGDAGDASGTSAVQAASHEQQRAAQRVRVSASGGAGSSNDVQQIANWYNELPAGTLASRQESRILSMRQYNNWVKSVLIKRVTSAGAHVLDICSGKGGDQKKWERAGATHVVFADHAAVSVEQCVERYVALRRCPYSADFIAADCFAVDLSTVLRPGLTFDVVSCQFALHYAFETEARAHQLLRNCSSRLRPGGSFVCTIPLAWRLVKRLRESPGLSFGNSVYEITFDRKRPLTAFGSRYLFKLDELVDSPEYLVEIEVLKDVARTYGLHLAEYVPFHDMYEKQKNGEMMQLFDTLGVVNSTGTVSPDEWEAIGLYVALVFEKRSGAPVPFVAKPPLGPRGVFNKADIVRIGVSSS